MPPRKAKKAVEDSSDDTTNKRQKTVQVDGPLVSLLGDEDPKHRLMTRPWQYRFDDAIVHKDCHTIPAKSSGSTVVLPKVACFDMDGTLIRVKSGAKFPKNAADWEWWDESVVAKLKELHEQGWEVVIMTNQLDSIKEGRIAALKTKIDTITAELGFPISVYIATKKDMFRKPSRGMFDIMLDKYHDLLAAQYPGQKLDKLISDESYFVGDAAGRKKTSSRAKDHSSADLQFAMNCFALDLAAVTKKGFIVPEAYFLKQANENDHKLMSIGVSPYSLFTKEALSWKWENAALFKWLEQSPQKPQLIVMCAGPAVGKTGFAHRIIEKYPDVVWINQDSLKTLDKCIAAAKQALQQGKSVVVDNTNPQRETRAKYAKIASELKCDYHCVHIECSKDVSFHLNCVRTAHTFGRVERISSMPIHMIYKKMEPPTKAEGFDTITTIPFVPRLHPLHTEDSPRLTPPPFGPTPIDETTPDHLKPSTINPTLQKHPELIKEFGHVSNSRTLADYFYQWYD